MKFQLLRFTNTLILASVGLLTLTGVYGLFWSLHGWVFDLHRWSGWLLLALIPWKTAISFRSLRRGFGGGFDRGLLMLVSLLLAALTLLVLALGFAWGWRFAPEQLWLRQTAISWHWMLALGLLVPFAIHAWRRWPRPKQVDFTSRRAFLKLLGLGAASLAGWWASGILATRRNTQASPRRFTGSRREGLFSGNDFPVTQSRASGQIDPASWRLVVDGAVSSGDNGIKPAAHQTTHRAYSYPELLSLDQEERIATLDCTLGWYTIQNWKGILLSDLLAQSGASPRAFAVRLESVTGYAQILPMKEAEHVLLATHVGDQVLDHVHGFPLRAVVPSRRGWFWVKWLTRIEIIALDPSA
jgi:DMSO/TMAO reductase YedYZ molybdopterin-dependent catalytic subunit